MAKLDVVMANLRNEMTALVRAVEEQGKDLKEVKAALKRLEKATKKKAPEEPVEAETPTTPDT